MLSKLYVGLSAQLAYQRRLDTVANNISNLSTTGYRAEEVSFASIVSHASADPVSFASKGDSYISRRQGEIVRTGNPLDVAVTGDAWLGIETPAGRVMTRDGRLTMTPTGELRTVNGHRILDAGGTAIQVNPTGGPISIARDGTITQGGQQVGAIGLFQIPPDAKLTRFENSGVIPDKPAVAQLDFNAAGVMQGFTERSNVNPVKEMTRMIELQRSFDAVSTTMNDIEGSLTEAIRSLGGSN
jgi:flagellar basal-body rod protein FlgF